MNAVDCLTDDALLAYQSGISDAAIIDAVAAHLRHCGECLSRLQAVEGIDDPLLRALRRQNPAPPGRIDPAIAAAVARLDFPAGPLPRGSLLNEYRLLEKLGSGGMGTVYRALHVRLDKEVALKVIHPLRVRDPRMRERFGHEMRAIGKLRHPHIVLATDAGEAQEVLYLVMELEQGADLAQYLHEHGPLPIAEACEYARQAALGLHAAHEAGLVHRDVKPSNLFRTAGGQLKLLDLGLALLEIEETPPDAPEPSLGVDTVADSSPQATARTHGPLGTDDYIAPEQWSDSHRVDPRADLYSLGCTLYFLLTGQPPFAVPRPATRGQVREAHLHATPPRLRELRPDAPLRLEALIHRLLAKQPENRPDSAAEVARELSAIAHPKPRNVLWAGAAVLAILVLAVALNWPPSEPVATAISQAPDSPRLQDAQPMPMAVSPMTPAEAGRLQERWANDLKQPVAFENSFGMKFSLIPPGEIHWTGRSSIVIGEPYYLAVTEVTMEQFREFVSATGHRTTAEESGQGSTLINVEDSGKNFRSSDIVWSKPGFPMEGESCPVVHVSWDDAVAFCAWLSSTDGLTYRLPTVAEWTWAGRAGYGGQESPGGHTALSKTDWFKENSGNRPHFVGKLQPNPWGLYDVLGNVSEWSLDRPSTGDTGRRFDAPVPAKGPSCAYLGSNYLAYTCRFIVEDSSNIEPTFVSSGLGFRVVCDVKPGQVPPPLGTLPMSAAEAQNLQQRWADYLGQPLATTNSIGMNMVLVPPGKFAAGRSLLILPGPYEIGATEVTRGQFRAFVLDNNYQTQAEASGEGGVLYYQARPTKGGKNPAFLWREPGYANTADDHPVVHVTWDDASAFCEWLSRREKRKYRLPTAAQWQWAARAGADTAFYQGADGERLADYAWHLGNSDQRPQAVAQKLPNAWGLYDVLGNVAELVRDGPGSWRAGPIRDPEMPLGEKTRMVLGGYYLQELTTKGANDISLNASAAVSMHEASSSNGFRVVRER